MAELQKATVMAIVEEDTAGELKFPTADTDFIPLRSGFSAEATVEEIESDELLDDIGASEPSIGKETPSGSHPIYLKHSEVEGQAPEYGLLLHSSLGGKTVNAVEFDTVGGSTVGVLNVDAGEGASFEKGQAVLVKDGVNGFNIRNIDTISTDALNLNFNLPNAPLLGVNLGKAITYKPQSTGHPDFSVFLYRGNGAALEAYAGNKTSSFTANLTSGALAEAEFGYEGTEFFFNPIEITSTNKFIDFKDLIAGSELTATLTEKVYKSPLDLGREIATEMTAQSLASESDTISVTFSETTGKFTITTSGPEFQLLWSSGTNTANTTGTTIGFTVSSDDTGATTYEADSELSYAAPFTPSFDDASNIRVVEAELMIGDATENFCRAVSNVSLTIDTPTVEVPDFCQTSGVEERLPESRTVTLVATLTLRKHEIGIFDNFINNNSTTAMVNVGPKTNDNWIPGKAVNIFIQNGKITTHTLGGDTFITKEITIKGFVSSTKKDVYINYL